MNLQTSKEQNTFFYKKIYIINILKRFLNKTDPQLFIFILENLLKSKF